MSAIRPFAAAVLLCGLTAGIGTGCSTDAVGVDDCRDIEQTRCDFVGVCGISSDVDVCKRFYRDQCLHGLAGGQPSKKVLNGCVGAISRAGACARTTGPDTKLGVCPGNVAVTGAATTLKTACDVILSPELIEECSFLSEVPIQPVKDAASETPAASDAGSDAAGD